MFIQIREHLINLNEVQQIFTVDSELLNLSNFDIVVDFKNKETLTISYTSKEKRDVNFNAISNYLLTGSLK